MAENCKEVVRWVCIGRRFGITPKKELVHVYIDEKNKEKVFTKPLSSDKHKDIVGGLYEGMVQHHDDERLTAIGDWKWCGEAWREDKEESTQWRAEDEAALAEKRYHDKKKRAAADNPVYRALEPIKAAYNKTNTVGRRVIIAQVIEFITR